MKAFAENVKRVHYQAIKVQFTGSWQFSATWSIIIRLVDGHYFETGTTVHSSNWNSTCSGFIWCGCKSCIPCSSRDCGYKRSGFGFWMYISLLMFWFLCKFKKVICPDIIVRLERTIDGESWHLKSSHREFTRFPMKTYVLVPRSLLWMGK
jgi:hypothetical protein